MEKGEAVAFLKIAPFVATVLACISALLFFIYSAGFGFDITDEGFYLQSLLHPGDVEVGVSLWHQVLAPLLRVTGPDLTGFRVLGAAALGACVVFLGYRFETAHGYRPGAHGALRNWSIVALLVIGSLHYYALGLLTPSYNLQSLAAAIVTVAAAWRLVASPGRRTRRHLMLCVLIGVGCALSALARPTGAISLATVTVIWIALSIRSRDVWLYVLWSASVAIVLVGLQIAVMALYLDLGVMSFFRRGAEVYTGLLAGHSIERFLVEHPLRLAGLVIGSFGGAAVLAILVLAVADAVLPRMAALLRDRSARIERLPSGWRDRSLALLALAALFAAPLIGPMRLEHFSEGLANLAGVLTGGYAYLAIRAIRVARHAGSEPRDMPDRRVVMQPVAFGAFCLMVSYSVSFGTNASIILHMSLSSVFAVLFMIRLALGAEHLFGQKHALAAVSLVISVAVLSNVQASLIQHYRSPEPIFSMAERVDIAGLGAVRLDVATAQYLRDLRAAAESHGFIPGTPLIDLTGGTPGAAVILQAKAPVMPWIVGGYSGSETVSRFLLGQMSPSDTAHAWILTAPGGTRSLSSDVLDGIGRVLEADYQPVATLTTGHRAETQILWRPRPR